MILIYKNFITEEECEQLNNWVSIAIKNHWLDKGINRGSNWDYSYRLTTRKYGHLFDYSKEVYDVQNKIDQFLKIQDLKKSVDGGGKNGIVVSCTFDCGDVYPHIDPKEGNLEVVRCNILTKKSESGGELFIGGNQIDIEVGDLHCYLPSTVEHYVTEVKGETSRVLWMFGYQCSKERFKQICNDHKQT
jgi:hypothetical protein